VRTRAQDEDAPGAGNADNVSLSVVKAACEKGHRVLPWGTAKPHKEDTMADPTIPSGHRDGVALMEDLRNMGLEPHESFLQEGLQRLTQTVIELEAAEQVGAGR